MSQKKKTLYSVHPGVSMVQTSMKNLEERTGLTIDNWVRRVQKEGPKTEVERRQWLKDVHGMGTNYARWIAERADGKGMEDTDPETYLEAAERYVTDMYAGPKSALFPIYEKLLKTGLSLGKDVKACPCLTMVPLYRNHVIAQIKPSTKTRIDFGLALGDLAATGRLVDTGGYAKKDRITHRIPITSIDEIDDDFMHWLELAYKLDA